MRLVRLILLAALVFTALAAVWALVFSEFDETAAKILGTSASVAGYSLIVMGAAAGGGPGRPAPARLAALVSTVASVAALGLIVFIMWRDHAWRTEWIVRAYFHATIAAIALAIAVLLARVPVPASQSWIRAAAIGLVLAFAAFADVLWIVVGHQSDGWNRAAGVVGVLAALGILALPILAWQGRREARAVAAVHGPRATCPQCGHSFEVTAGTSAPAASPAAYDRLAGGT
jgi:hypothetical protein